MRLNKRFLTLLVGASSFIVTGGALHAETLEQAVQMTLSSHPSIDTAKVGSSVAEEQKREERSGYFPTVGISGQTGRIYGDNSTSRGLTVSRGSAYSNYWEGALTARQPIYNGFQTGNRVESAEAKINSANMTLLDVSERLAFGVAQAYVDLLRARKGLVMLQAQAGKVSDYEKRIKNMVDEGAADEAEHQQARDIRVILDNMISDYQGQARKAEAYYTELTGNLPAEELVVPTPHIELIPENIDEAIAYAKGNHPALKAAKLTSESAEYDAAAEKGALYPELDGEFSYMESDKEETLGGEVTDGRAIVRLNWDFETGGAQLARIEQKKLRQKESVSQMYEMERQMERAIRLAYADRQTAQQQSEGQQRRYDLNKKLFETYNVQFEGARITLLQLMQSDNQLFTTQLEKMNGTFRSVVAEYAILAGMGRLTETLDATVAQAAPAVSSAAPSLTRPAADEQE